jgi:hypothetical protein
MGDIQKGIQHNSKYYMYKGIKHKVLNVARDTERDSEQGRKLPLSFTQKISVAPSPKTVYSNMLQTSYRSFMRLSTLSRQSGWHNILRYWQNLIHAHSSLIGPFCFLKENKLADVITMLLVWLSVTSIFNGLIKSVIYSKTGMNLVPL